jgi:hypothetical protein
MKPRDVGRIVIIDGQLSQERTTRNLYVTLEMLISRGVWTSVSSLLATQIVVAACCSLAGCPAHVTLIGALVSGVVGVAIRGVLAWLSARKWRDTVSDDY